MRSRSVCFEPIHGSVFGRLGMPAFSVAFVNVDQRECQVGDQIPEWDGQCLSTTDENVIMVAAQWKIRRRANDLAQPSPDPITLCRGSDLARDGKPDPGFVGTGDLPTPRLQAEPPCVEPPAARYGEKIFAHLKPACGDPLRGRMRDGTGILGRCGHGEAAEAAPIRRRGACGRAPDGRRLPDDRRRSPCASESRDDASERACWADKSASR